MSTHNEDYPTQTEESERSLGRNQSRGMTGRHLGEMTVGNRSHLKEQKWSIGQRCSDWEYSKCFRKGKSKKCMGTCDKQAQSYTGDVAKRIHALCPGSLVSPKRLEKAVNIFQKSTWYYLFYVSKKSLKCIMSSKGTKMKARKWTGE